ncbi:MAG: GAF and ANTAR domain-containing protein [Acidimicrobiales bacterium]|jgi:GAF domain-containing protein
MASADDVPTSQAGPTTDLIVNFTRTAQGLFQAGGVELTLQAVADLAVATIEGCDFAGLFVLNAGNVTAPVHTAPVVAELHALQLTSHEGPCLDCMAQGTAVYAEDLADDPRWPNFGPQAAGTGVRSLLALCLSGDGQATGALNLYARYPLAFGAMDRARGLVLAGLAGLALSVAEAHEEELRRAENLRQALITRELIGQAQGILMERERITAAQAFDILRRASQHLNTKLREVAQDLVETGERPPTGSGERPLPGSGGP